MDKVISKSIKLASLSAGKVLRFEAANLAKFADGSCTCSLGDTSVLVTSVSEQNKLSEQAFAPISVDYRQKSAAAGRIPMTHLRRDTGITEREILIGRMIDRSIRSSFPEGYNQETQIVCNLLAVDSHNEADIVAINGASASLSISDIPWNGPIGSVRIGLEGNNVLINPTRREMYNSRLNLVMTANRIGNLVMLDGHCHEPINPVDLHKVIKRGVKECTIIVEAIQQLQQEIGKKKRDFSPSHLPSREHLEFALTTAEAQLESVLSDHSLDKIARGKATDTVRSELSDKMKERFPEIRDALINTTFIKIIKDVHKRVLDRSKVRCDGRAFDQLRPLNCAVDIYKPLHGSAVFQRGQTQVFCSTTFDSPDAAIRYDPISVLMSGVKDKNFMLHYEFPPYATNEVGRLTSLPSRREIGHGALAEKAIRPVIPDNSDMTIRLNCEVMESNGSSSMASVSAGSMSLMDAGVPIKEHVAGVAMGLMSNLSSKDFSSKKTVSKSEYNVLTDISGFEDFFGDMDFKIAGTRRAITAIQLDVKPTFGLPLAIANDAIQSSGAARLEIIKTMETAIRVPRSQRKDNHPVIKTIHIPAHKRSTFLGFGGANLKKLTAQIGVRVTPCDEDSQDLDTSMPEGPDLMPRGNFTIFAPNQEAMDEAEEFIKTLIEKQSEPELEFNGIYTAIIEEIRSNGVMVSLYPNMRPALLPLSQLDTKVVTHPSALFKVGQQIQVKYFGRDPANGQMRLSRKSLMMSSIPRVRQMSTQEVP